MKTYRKAPVRPNAPRSSWSMHTRKGSVSQQKSRETNGRPNREQMAINSEIAGDSGWKRQDKQDEPDVDKARINAERKRSLIAQVHDDIRARFGPRLVRSDGSALYQFQCK